MRYGFRLGEDRVTSAVGPGGAKKEDGHGVSSPYDIKLLIINNLGLNWTDLG